MQSCWRKRRKPTASTGRPRDEMRELLAVKANVDRLLGTWEQEAEKERNTMALSLPCSKAFRRNARQLRHGAVQKGLGESPTSSVWEPVAIQRHCLPTARRLRPGCAFCPSQNKNSGTSQTAASEFTGQDGNRQIAATGRSRTG